MIEIDWGDTYVIFVPQSYLTLVSGTLYKLDTNQFRLTLKELEATKEGIPHPKTHIHNTEVTVSGTTFARTVEILPPYSVEFEDGAYSVQLIGSNNNIFDIQTGILVQNQVQVIPTNSAGLIVSPNLGGALDWSDAERRQIREALGIDGDKVTATGGQVQIIKDQSEISAIHAVDKLNE